jgi:hypothetical protein
MTRWLSILAIACAACGGGDAEPQQPDGAVDTPGPQYKRVFITRQEFTGNLKLAGGELDGIESADKLCLNAAMAADLGGSWRAWIGDSAITPGETVVDVGPWKNISGSVEIFATKPSFGAMPQNWSQLELEDGQAITGRLDAWTGPGTDSSPCNDWTAEIYPKCSAVGIVGNGEDGSGGTWESGTCKLCNDTAHLYCFEQ